VLRHARAETALGAIENGNPDAQGSEIYAGNDAHGGLRAGHAQPLRVAVYAPAQIACGGFLDRGGYGRQVGGYVVLEAALADVAEQLLQPGDAHHAGAAKSFERIVGELAFAHVALNG